MALNSFILRKRNKKLIIFYRCKVSDFQHRRLKLIKTLAAWIYFYFFYINPGPNSGPDCVREREVSRRISALKCSVPHRSFPCPVRSFGVNPFTWSNLLRLSSVAIPRI